MAKPTTYVGSSVALVLEGTPAGTWTRPCGLTNHTITFSKNTQDITVPDCDNLEAAAWIERGVESLDMQGSGNGILAAESLDRWWAVFNSTTSVNARLYVGAMDDAVNGHYWAGKIHITSLEIGGERGNKAQATVSFVSDGEMTYNDVAP